MAKIQALPFRADDLKLIIPQKEQEQQLSWISRAALKAMENEWSFTGWLEGKPIGAIGAVPIWTNRYSAWAILSNECGKHMLPITRLVKHWITVSPPGRYEAISGVTFPQGLRWLHMLGFRCVECPAKGICPDGTDGALFVMNIEP